MAVVKVALCTDCLARVACRVARMECRWLSCMHAEGSCDNHAIPSLLIFSSRQALQARQHRWNGTKCGEGKECTAGTCAAHCRAQEEGLAEGLGGGPTSRRRFRLFGCMGWANRSPSPAFGHRESLWAACDLRGRVVLPLRWAGCPGGRDTQSQGQGGLRSPQLIGRRETDSGSGISMQRIEHISCMVMVTVPAHRKQF